MWESDAHVIILFYLRTINSWDYNFPQMWKPIPSEISGYFISHGNGIIFGSSSDQSSLGRFKYGFGSSAVQVGSGQHI